MICTKCIYYDYSCWQIQLHHSFLEIDLAYKQGKNVELFYK